METEDESGNESQQKTDDDQSEQEEDDTAFEYATDLMSLGMLYLEFRDAVRDCLLYTSPSPRDATLSRMPSSA